MSARAGRTLAVALTGPTGAMVEIEASVTSQKPGVQLVGLPDAAVREAQVRVRNAVEHSGFEWPNRHLTINLSPAMLPKRGAAFDLGIAMAVLAADGVVAIPPRTVHLGELALDGRLRPGSGVLPSVLAARDAGCDTVVLPAGDAAEAALVDGVRVVGVPSLRAAAIAAGAEIEEVPLDAIEPPHAREVATTSGDLADVVGNAGAVEALVVAAAGAHHLLMVGPPGAGKTLLATRLPGLLPDLAGRRSLEATCIASLNGASPRALVTRPPWEAPHHTSSAGGLIGGGSGMLRPGAAARASGGVLFLDEAPEFGERALNALRQPLESGSITVGRVGAVATWPGRFQLVLAANPCPCGRLGSPDGGCRCAPQAQRRYLERISGPLRDRIDIRLRVERVSAAQLRAAEGLPRPTTAAARARVLAARARSATRLAGTPWSVNSETSGTWLREGPHRPSPSARAPLDRAFERGRLTMRGYDRVLRVAWTVADLAGADALQAEHIGAALTLRNEDG